MREAFPPLAQHGMCDMNKDERADLEFEALKPYLPVTCNNIMDIGSGMARLPARIARFVEATTAPRITVYLMDGEAHVERTDKERTGYRTTIMGPWADGREGIDTVRALAPHASCVFVAAYPQWQSPRPLDLVTSFRSWAHHYPVSVYLQMVSRSLRPGGILITDVRKRTNGIAELEAAGFVQVSDSIELDSFKSQRLVFRYK